MCKKLAITVGPNLPVPVVLFTYLYLLVLFVLPFAPSDYTRPVGIAGNTTALFRASVEVPVLDVLVTNVRFWTTFISHKSYPWEVSKTCTCKARMIEGYYL